MEGSVRKRGKKWYYSFDLGKDENGKRKRIEKVGGETKKEALETLRREIMKFENDFSKKRLYSLLEEYYSLKNSKLKFHTMQQKRGFINAIKHIIDDVYLSEINHENIINSIKNTYSITYGNRFLKFLSNVFEYALSENYLDQHIYLKYKFSLDKNTTSKEKTFVTLNELEKLFDKLTIYEELLIKLMMSTGLRLGEALGLSWENIDFNNRLIKVKYSQISANMLNTPKTKKGSREIYMDNNSKEILEKLLILKREKTYSIVEKDNNFILKDYQNEYQRFSPIFLNRFFEPLSKKAVILKITRINKEIGIKFTSHFCRVHHSTMLFENGVNTKVILNRLGHLKIETTYNNYYKIPKEVSDSENKKIDLLSANSKQK